MKGWNKVLTRRDQTLSVKNIRVKYGPTQLHVLKMDMEYIRGTKIGFFWNVTQCISLPVSRKKNSAVSISYSEEGRMRVLRNICIHLPN